MSKSGRRARRAARLSSNWRARAMRVLTFDGQNEEHHSIFNLLGMAWHYVDERRQPLVQIGDSPERLDLAVTINRQIAAGMKQIGPGSFDLRDDGAEIRIREPGFQLLKSFWEAYRRTIPPMMAE